MKRPQNKTAMLILSLILLSSLNARCLKIEGFVPSNISDTSQYLQKIEIPKYDSKNPEHFLITTSNNGWGQINNPIYRYFYVAPGTYRSVQITQSGTVEKPRYISLQNDNDLHPGQLNDNQQANLEIQFSGAENWIVDRISSLDDITNNYSVFIRNGAKNITLNRLYIRNFFAAIGIISDNGNNYSRNITIQNCRFENMSRTGISNDALGITLAPPSGTSNVKIEDVHIINNEIINCNDGIGTERYFNNSKAILADFSGLIISDNHIYVDSHVYTDGSGNLNTDGNYALTENAIDLKAGSENPNKPVIIKNNYIWGCRKTDTNGGGSGSNGEGIVCHYDVKNANITNNVVFYCNCGIIFGDPHGLPYSGENLVISKNIIANISEHNDLKTNSAEFSSTKNVKFENNVIVGKSMQSTWFQTYGDEVDLTISNNVLVNMSQKKGYNSTSTSVNNNFFYNTILQYPSDGVAYNNASDANMADLTFTTDKFTNHPRTITLFGVVSTPQSPHYSIFTK